MQGFEQLLGNALRNADTSALIEARNFWIFTPMTVEVRDLIQPDDWQSVCKPGAILGMSFFLDRPELLNSSAGLMDLEQADGHLIQYNDAACHAPYLSSTEYALDSATLDLIRLSKPAPFWWQNPDMRFRRG